MNNQSTNILFSLLSNIGHLRKVQFLIFICLMVFASLAELMSIGSVIPFLSVLAMPEKFLQHELVVQLIYLIGDISATELVLFCGTIFCMAAIASGAMRLVLLWFQTHLAHGIGADFSYQIYRRTLYQPYATHLNRNSSELISSVTDKASNVVSNTVMPLLTIISSSTLAITMLLGLIFVQPIIALSALLGFSSIYLFTVFLTREKLFRNSQTISKKTIAVIKNLQEGFGGIRDITLDGTQDFYCESFRKSDVSLRMAYASNAMISGAPRFLIEALGMVLIGIIAIFASGFGHGLVEAIPVLGVLALCAQRLLPILQQIYSSWAAMRGSWVVLEDALVMLQQPIPVDMLSSNCCQIFFKHAITLKDINYKYESDSALVLKGINLEIKKGEKVGVIGATGSGKSTLIDLIMGLLSPTEGSLMVDDVMLNAANSKLWHKHIAHVPQMIFLTDASIAENIAFGVSPDQINFEKLKSCAAKAQLHQVVESWVGGYDTIVGERGVKLSGGQRQRIGIARALYKNADVIILDEATSALDQQTESLVMDSMYAMNPDLTFLIVAHRLTTLRHCSKIIELEHGVLRRSGSYEEIIG